MFLREGEFANLSTIETPRLLLRKLTMADANDVHAYSTDPQVAQYVQWTPHRNIAETRAFLRYMIRLYKTDAPSSWGIVWKPTGRVIGTAGYMWYNRENNSVEVGYSLAREFWNQGIMTEALQAILTHAFEHLGVHRIEAQHDVRNPASGRVMQKVGMQKEGVLRGRLYNKGSYIDVALYAILEQDYYSRVQNNAR